jgi:hypothetical protein
MRRHVVSLVALVWVAACSYDKSTAPSSDLGAPASLSYQLVPSGDPNTPGGVILRWEPPNDSRVTNYVVYSRASTSASWSRRAETTSASFHDLGLPDLQYYVTSQASDGTESASSNVVTVDQSNRLPPPSQLTSISLDTAIQLSWPADARITDPGLFDYYRVYSTPYNLDTGVCSGSDWVLEGTTVSEDFIASGLANGVPRCFAVSTVSRDGHESQWTTPRADTPRYDARNVLLYAKSTSLANSGFSFFLPTTSQYGLVTSGSRADIDFRLDRNADGSLWMVPVRAGTVVALYSSSPIPDLTSIDVAPPRSSFSPSAIQAVTGYGYVFETQLADGLHYGGLRVTHVGADYIIFDWSYQTDHGNPELRVVSNRR